MGTALWFAACSGAAVTTSPDTSRASADAGTDAEMPPSGSTGDADAQDFSPVTDGGTGVHDASVAKDATTPQMDAAVFLDAALDPSPLVVAVAPQAASTMLMRAIWGSDADNVYFCGDDYPYDGGLWRWNGTVLGRVQTVRGRCASVAGAGRDNVWVRWDAVAGEVSGTFYRYDGATWAKAPQFFNLVLPTDATSAVGFAGIYNGSRTMAYMTFSDWISGSAVTSTTNLPVSCSAPGYPPVAGSGRTFGTNDIWAKVGDKCVVHWDGAAWTPVQPAGLATIVQLHGSVTNDMWAAGTGACPVSHWNGASWTGTCAGLPAAETSMRAVYGAPNGLAWAVGAKGIYAFDGTTWSSVVKPAAIGATEIYAVWGSGVADVWFSGEKGTILRTR